MSRIAAVFFVVALGAILVATLVSGPTSPTQSPVEWPDCLLCSDTIAADAIVNILLYAPLGSAAALVGWSWRRTLVLALLLSGGVEVAQGAIPGRHASLLDVGFNALGVLLGVALARSSKWWLRPRAAVAQHLRAAWTAVVLAVFFLTAALLRPAIPPSSYSVQWTPALSGLATYQGHVLEASLGRIRLPVGPVPDAQEVRALLRGTAPLQVRLVAGSPVPGLAPILEVARPDGWRVALLSADGEELLFMVRKWASVLRLHEPALRAQEALRREFAGDTIAIDVIRDPAGHALIVDEAQWPGLGPPTLAMGWTLLLSDRFPVWLRTPLSILWVAILVMPIGFWSRSGRSVLLGVVVITITLALVPVLPDVGTSGWCEYLGLAVGVTGGRLLGRAVHRAGSADPMNTST